MPTVEWGVTSFRQDRQRRTTRSPTGRLGVMMHVPDDPALHELRPKGSHSKTYLGLEAPSGQVQGREILSINEREMVMRYVARTPTTPRHLRLAGQKGDTHETLRAGSGFRRQFPTASNKKTTRHPVGGTFILHAPSVSFRLNPAI